MRPIFGPIPTSRIRIDPVQFTRPSRSAKEMGFPVVLDVTHSLQLPSAAGHASGGQPEFIEPLARAGVAAGVDGLFMEVHDNPAKALSDGANSLPLKQLRGLLERLSELAQVVRRW